MLGNATQTILSLRARIAQLERTTYLNGVTSPDQLPLSPVVEAASTATAMLVHRASPPPAPETASAPSDWAGDFRSPVHRSPVPVGWSILGGTSPPPRPSSTMLEMLGMPSFSSSDAAAGTINGESVHALPAAAAPVGGDGDGLQSPSSAWWSGR